MSEEIGDSAGGVAIVPPADTGTELSIADATRAYTAAVTKKPDPAESAESATAENELAQANDGTDENPPPGEEPDGNDPEAEKLPPIERPRSWSKDDDDDWNALPRARQEKIATSERAREADINRRINDAAEKLKGLTAKEQQAEQARQQYEAQAKAALAVLEREQLRDFPDIKNDDDIRKLAETDPFRYLQWDAHQKSMAVAFQASKGADERQAQEHQMQWQDYRQKQDALAGELIPDLADEIKATALHKRAIARLTELGFKPEELNALASGKQAIPVYDHRLQVLINDSLKLADIQKAKAAIAAKPLPTVARPGTSKSAGQGVSDQIQALTRKFEQSGDLRDATALYEAQQRAQRRSA